MSVNSRVWEQYFKKYADEIYKEIEKLGYNAFIFYDKTAVKKAFDFYEREIKVHIDKYMLKPDPKTNKNYTDRHKILAGYIWAFIKNQVFIIDTTKRGEYIKNLKKEKNDDNIKLHNLGAYPNEVFLCRLIPEILRGFAIKHKKSVIQESDYTIYYPDNIFNWEERQYSEYTDHLIKLLYHYMNTDEPIAHQRAYPVFAFSNILFFIEMCSDCVKYDLSKFYFK